MPNDPQPDIAQSLREIGFRSSSDALSALLTHAHKSRLGPTETIAGLVSLERRTRDVNNLARRTRDAQLGRFTPIDRFDWAHPREIDRVLFERLLSLDFISVAENVLLRGQSGVGKTMLAQCLGQAALERGLTVCFSTLATVLADLLRRDSLPAFERRLKRYIQPDLLILDELGYLPCDNHAADILYNLVSRRHEQRSTVITTNLAFKQWGTIFPGAACIVALVDRFAQHCHRVEIDADSWRDKHNLEHGEHTSPPVPPPRRSKRK